MARELKNRKKDIDPAMIELLEENARLKAENKAKGNPPDDVSHITGKYDKQLAELKDLYDSGDDGAFDKMIKLELEKSKAVEKYTSEKASASKDLSSDDIVSILKSVGVETTVDDIESKLSIKTMNAVKKDGVKGNIKAIIDSLGDDASVGTPSSNKGVDPAKKEESNPVFKVLGTNENGKAEDDIVTLKGVKDFASGKLNGTMELTSSEYRKLMSDVEDTIEIEAKVRDIDKTISELNNM